MSPEETREALAQYLSPSGKLRIEIDPGVGDEGPVDLNCVWVLEVGTLTQRITADMVCRGAVAPIELADEDGSIVYRAPSTIRHVACIYDGGALVKHAYQAIPVVPAGELAYIPPPGAT